MFVTNLATLQKVQYLVLMILFVLHVWEFLLPFGSHECVKSVEAIETVCSSMTGLEIIKEGTLYSKVEFTVWQLHARRCSTTGLFTTYLIEH